MSVLELILTFFQALEELLEKDAKKLKESCIDTEKVGFFT